MDLLEYVAAVKLWQGSGLEPLRCETCGDMLFGIYKDKTILLTCQARHHYTDIPTFVIEKYLGKN